ncbi:MAG TPA: DUF222 domain-containing protein [Streptosporangiaceae bacterium]|nr:DUF222 domain-containing protein [Streptosporangiaceae bacterium]
MCTGQSPSSVTEALAAVRDGLAFLNAVDAAGLPAPVQAECLRELARADAAHTAAQTRVLTAFTASGGHEDDGQQSARAWLKWQTQVTGGVAAGAVSWMNRLATHPAVGQALAEGGISPSWAREICGWTNLLPEGQRAGADEILLKAAAGGACLADLAGLAEEMRRRAAGPDTGPDDGFDDRKLRLGVTFGGAGRLDGDLTPGCAAALAAVLEALGKKAGPEDDRTAPQRRHDALEEACRRLIGSACLPDRAGQSTMVQLHLTLDQLRDMPGGADAEAAWAAVQGAGDGQPGWLSGRAAQAYACDATITPIVSGHVDQAALTAMTAAFLAGTPGPRCRCGGCTCPPGARPARPLRPAARTRLQDTLLRYAADVLSGPAGLAAFLRTGLTADQFPAVSLPLDTGAATEQVPANLRRAVIARDRRCAFPGCHQRPAACHVHHIRPRAKGGATRLDNLVLLCAFHHLVAVHQWGWTITLHADGTVAAVSPDGKRTLHSHGPPTKAA